MSFGWSAGDIAQAISLIVKVIKALDDASGAPDEYRKMAVFLENVNLTLKNLHVFATLGVYPSYGDEIRRQIENVRPPLARFIKIMKNYEPHLGSNATPGWWKNIPRKMLWTFKHSHHKLKKEIKDHLFTLDNLLNRFTLEIVLTLPDELKQLFINALTPQMISALEVMVNPVRNEISLMRNEGRMQQKELHSKTEEIILLLQSLKMNDSKSKNTGALDAAVHDIKEHITSTLGSTSNNPQIPIIDSCSQAACKADSLPATNVLFQAMNKDLLEASDEEIKQSLRNICPDTSCSGVLINITNSTWKRCSSCQKDVLEPEVAKNIEKSYASLSQGAMERHEIEGSQAVNTAIFARCVYRLNLRLSTVIESPHSLSSILSPTFSVAEFWNSKLGLKSTPKQLVKWNRLGEKFDHILKPIFEQEKKTSNSIIRICPRAATKRVEP
ncbi:hypothetical protein BOTNAR_0159g00180 [Botryotinia narcissicola]|uniref:NACHT-NTPase and P-loop NTPases N-terminal domain-containing protein n=1 Tax=Botryotinia narcissicola TaxID=278944 RepID=A0A4Z1IDA0_9HELO|nr:hypothetical protein BOTNAR_0159g00180 [Botryotinia narcissicola]